MSNSVYEIIKENVINQLAHGIVPWRRCYNISGSGDFCISHRSGEPYSLVNQFLLKKGGEYWTFKNAIEEGYTIRKGSKASKVVFWKILKNDDDDTRCIPCLRYYNVFHESDIEGLPPKPISGMDEHTRRLRNDEKIAKASEIISKYLEQINPDLRVAECDTVPCYCHHGNIIKIPERARFTNINLYYSTLFHEIVHSTKDVLNRGVKYSMGQQDRAREELVAEIGAAYLCGQSGILIDDVIQDSSSYCAGWLKSLNDNISNLLWASKRAEEAVSYILGTKFEDIKEDEQKD